MWLWLLNSFFILLLILPRLCTWIQHHQFVKMLVFKRNKLTNRKKIVVNSSFIHIVWAIWMIAHSFLVHLKKAGEWGSWIVCTNKAIQKNGFNSLNNAWNYNHYVIYYSDQHAYLGCYTDSISAIAAPGLFQVSVIIPFGIQSRTLYSIHRSFSVCFLSLGETIYQLILTINLSHLCTACFPSEPDHVTLKHYQTQGLNLE